jgi:hypothetical protein
MPSSLSVNTHRANPAGQYLSKTTEVSKAGHATQDAPRRSLKPHLRGVRKSEAAATKHWHKATSYTDADVRDTMQKLSTDFPLGKARIALGEIKENKNRRFHPQAAASNGWGDLFLAGLTAVTAVTGMFKLSGTAGNADADGLSRKPREAGNMDQARLDATATSPSGLLISTPADNASVVSPMPELNGIINWRAFDEAEFLRRCGVQFDDTIPGRLRAMYECFHPQTETKKLPLDISQFDNEKVEHFVKAVMASTGYAYESEGPTDPEFSQHLFKLWFPQLAAPPTGNGGGGDAGDAGPAAPFHKDLLKLTHPDTPHRKSCSDGKDVAPLLPRIGSLKQELRTQFLKSYERFGAGPAYEWAFEGLCQLFEPTLVRGDLPEALRYGSLAWVQLSIGIALAGDDHINLTLPELTSLAAVFDVFGGDPNEASLLAIRRNAMQAVLRMAHTHGKLDLSTLPEIKQEHLESALAFYQSQLALEAAKLPPMEALVDRLPTRREIAGKMLRAVGISGISGKSDDTRRFRAFNQHLQNHHGVSLPNTPRESSCIPWGEAHTLSDIFTMDCLPQMQLPASPLTDREKALLQSPMLTHDELEQRFNQNFDTAWASLGREILVPALQDQIEFMDPGDEEFLRCGEVKMLGIPTALIETRFSTARRQGVIGVGAGPTEWIKYTAKGKVLIEVEMARDGKKETRNFCASLHPLEFRSYKGSAKKLLKENLHDFFKAADGSSLVSLSDRYEPAYGSTYGSTYTQHKPGGVPGDLLEAISTLLLADLGESLRENAHQTTEPEKLRAEIREMLLDWIPFRACLMGLRANEPSAAIYCTLDIASLFPVVKAGKAGVSGIAALTRLEIANLGRALLFNSVEGGGRKTIENVFKLAPRIINFAKAGVGFVDPGFGLAWGLKSWGSRLGKAAVQSLLQKMRHYDVLSPVVKIVKKSARQAEKFYPRNGYWHARDNVVISGDQGRYVASGDQRYGVFDGGENKNILTIKTGDNLRLVNPQSGMGYGPLLRKSAVSGRLELISSRQSDAGNAAALCRVKRTGDASASGCDIVKDARFGASGYTRKNPPPEPTYQFRLTDADIPPSQFDVVQEHAGAADAAKRVRVVDAADHGYARYVRLGNGVWAGEIPAELEMPAIFPATLYGRIEHFAHPGSDTGADYVVFSNSHLADDGVQRETIEYHIPFGTYEEQYVKTSDGVETIERRVIGIATVNPLTTYRFSTDSAHIPLKIADRSVKLERASIEEFAQFENFQRLQHIDRHVADPALVDAVRLRDATPELREKFDRVFLRSEIIVNDAIAALKEHESEAIRIIARLTNQPEAQAHNLNSKLNEIVRTLSDRLHRTRALMRHIKEQSPHVVGFFDGNPSGAGSASSEGSAYRLSMDGRTDFTHSNKPLIFLREGDYVDKDIATDTRAATWLHELWHALFGTEDAMQLDGAPIYADVRRNRAALSRIRMAAGLPDSQPKNNAATLEHLTMMLAYLMHEDTRKLIAPFYTSAESYIRKMQPQDLDEAAGRSVQGPAPAPVPAPAPPADSTPLCSSKPAGAAAVCHVPLAPALRFGDHAYAQVKAPPVMKSQLTVNGAGETVLQAVDLRDIGFEDYLLNSERRWTPVTPVISAQHDAATGSWKGIDARMPLDDQLAGEVMEIPDKDGTSVSYVRVEFFNGNAQDDRMMHIRYMPFISYEDVDGTVKHQLAIGGRIYSFQWDRNSITSGGSVTLRIATAEESKKLAKYQGLLAMKYEVPGIDFSNTVRLRDQPIAFRREFDGVMVGAEAKLLDAIAVFETMPGLVRTICERFSSGDAAAVDLLISNIGARMSDMRDAFPYFIDQSADAIGIFTNRAGRKFNGVEGAAIPNSMKDRIGFSKMKNAVVFFNSRYCGENVSLEQRIENILHEWTHACTGTSDSPTGPGGPSLYAEHHAGRYDLTRLMEAARAPGGDPAQHAATLQHIITMLANFRDPKKQRLSHPFIYGQNFYFSDH